MLNKGLGCIEEREFCLIPTLMICFPPFGSVPLKIFTYFTEMFRLQILYFVQVLI